MTASHLLPLFAALLPGLTVATVPAPPGLETSYTADRALRIELTRSLTMETVDMSMERDGEPLPSPFEGRGSQASGETRALVRIDHVRAVDDDGRPLRVERSFDEAAGGSHAEFAGETQEREIESPLDGVTLALAEDEGGELTVEVIDGDEPDEASALEGHSLALGLDSLLPTEEVAVGDVWDLEPEDVVRGLELDLEAIAFPRADVPPADDQGRDGRGGRGGRGGGARGSRASFLRLMAGADWDGEAKLASLDEELDGLVCAKIEFTIGAEGAMAEPGFAGDRGGRAYGLPTSAAPRRANDYTIELEGALYFALEERRPVLFEIEGAVGTKRVIERERQGSSMTISVERAGTFTQTVMISPHEEEAEAEEASE